MNSSTTRMLRPTAGAPRWTRQKQRVVDRLMACLMLAMLLAMPFLDASAGLQDQESASGSPLSQAVRAGWIVCAAIHTAAFCRKLHPPFRLSMTLLFMFAATQLLSETLAEQPVTGIYAATKTIYFAITALVAHNLWLRRAVSHQFFSYGSLVAGASVAILSLMAGVGGRGTLNAYGSAGLEVSSTWYRSVTIPAFYMLLCGAAACRCLKPAHKLLWAMAICACVLLTALRAAALGFAVGAGVYATVRARGRRIANVMLLGAAGVTAGLLIFAYYPQVYTRWGDAAGSGRSSFQVMALDEFLSGTWPDRILGRGVSHTPHVLERRYGASIGSHNDAIDIALAWGLVGLSMWLGSIAATLRLSWIASRRDAPFARENLAACAAAGVFSLLHGTINYAGPMFVLAMLIGIAAAGAAADDPAKHPDRRAPQSDSDSAGRAAAR